MLSLVGFVVSLCTTPFLIVFWVEQNSSSGFSLLLFWQCWWIRLPRQVFTTKQSRRTGPAWQWQKAKKKVTKVHFACIVWDQMAWTHEQKGCFVGEKKVHQWSLGLKTRSGFFFFLVVVESTMSKVFESWLLNLLCYYQGVKAKVRSCLKLCQSNL